MSMKKFTKNIVKEFKTGFGRFIAIMAIIALGVGFLIGVTQATPDMKNTMSTYLIDNKAYDIDVKGTFGLTQADIDAIRGLKDDAGNEIVESVTPVISTDAVVTAGEYEVVGHPNPVRLHRVVRRVEEVSHLVVVKVRNSLFSLVSHLRKALKEWFAPIEI